MAYMLAPSSTALVSASTRQNHGICLLSAPLLSGLSGSLPFILLGKMGKVKIWQHPTRKTPAFMEAVLEKFYISMGSRSTSFHIHLHAERSIPPSAFPLETFTPVYFAQQSLVLPLPCCGISQSITSAFRSLSATEDQAWHVLVFHPAKSFTFFCI